MKTKTLLLIAIAAVLTLSFTFVSNPFSAKLSGDVQVEASSNPNGQPGGFAMEDKL